MLLAPRGLGNAGGGAWRRRSPRLLDDVRRRNRLRRRGRWAGSTRASAPVRRRALKEPRALAPSGASGRPCAPTSSWSIFSLTPSSFSASCGPERPSSSFWWTVSSLLSSSPCWTSRSLSGSKLVLSPRRARHLTRYDTPHPSLGQALTEPYSAGCRCRVHRRVRRLRAMLPQPRRTRPTRSPVDQLDRMDRRKLRARCDLNDATEIAGCDHVRSHSLDSPDFTLAQPPCDVRLQNIVDPGRTAA